MSRLATGFFDNLHKLLANISGYEGRDLDFRELNGKDAVEPIQGFDYRN